MQLRIFVLLITFPLLGVGQKTGASAEKIVVDRDSGKSSELENLEFIPREQLCLLCHTVIGKFQQASAKNPEQFKNVSLL
jgi:hypothetical protein